MGKTEFHIGSSLRNAARTVSDMCILYGAGVYCNLFFWNDISGKELYTIVVMGLCRLIFRLKIKESFFHAHVSSSYCCCFAFISALYDLDYAKAA